jgi:hypothetical protein
LPIIGTYRPHWNRSCSQLRRRRAGGRAAGDPVRRLARRPLGGACAVLKFRLLHSTCRSRATSSLWRWVSVLAKMDLS